MREAVALLEHAVDAPPRPRTRVPRRLDVLADRLGVSVETLEHYHRAHGGVPAADAAAAAHHGPEAADVEPGTGLRRPSPRADAPWVKRDKPRYFIAG